MDMNRLRITWIGHSCFKVEINGESIIFDPTNDDYVPGILPIRESANLVVCSHEHNDHNARELITIKDTETSFELTELNTYHDDKHGSLRGENKITIVKSGNVRFAHFGDLGCEPTEEQLEKLEGLNLVLIPIGGFFTISGTEAARIVKKIKPEFVIPMHYRDDDLGFGFDVISTEQEFLNAMGTWEYTEKSTVEIESKDSWTETNVLVMIPQNITKH